MPNWCDNSIHIEGENEVLKQVWDECFTNDVLDFDKVIPYPEPYRSMDANSGFCGAGFNAGGYEWRVENWGTKWNADFDESDFSLEDGFITGSCFTAWSPPLGVMMELSKKYPVRVVIEYDEAGMPFQGEIEYEDGVETVIYDRSGEDYVSNYEEEDD